MTLELHVRTDPESDDLETLFSALPPRIGGPLRLRPNKVELLEIVLDLGRRPEARYLDSEAELSDQEVTADDIDYVVARVGEFNEDNRAGIERTLHRISAIKNRQDRVVGITCRVGRAISGTIKIIEDLVESGGNILLLGKPGIGKTTMLREIARVLADDFHRRVIIVDTSNEIAGDGDIPHPALGHARRMQVPQPHLQHHVMIEAVENHMPEVIIIDEIGTEAEAAAARTIAERGVQLIGTAHGTRLDNLVQNPTLSDLIGGIQAVTLGDEEARRRRTRKTVLERKAPPTFGVVVEIRSRTEVAVHADIERTVDMMLRGAPPRPQSRKITVEGQVEETEPEQDALTVLNGSGGPAYQIEEEAALETTPEANARRASADVFAHGIGRGRLEETLYSLSLPFRVVDTIHSADVMLTTKQLYRRRTPAVRAAEETHVPVYVLRKNTPTQLQQALQSIANSKGLSEDIESIIEDTEESLQRVLSGDIDEIELRPQNAYVRRLQHQLANEASLGSRSNGREPNRRVRVFRESHAMAAGQ